ncbi:MAG TPA: hypothetical protein VN365_01290 [Candidatus Thermoplasmatota archaeon]|nr:hypothetical protein [Candidatus Thermoplasmatota archaeon]
MDRYYRLKDTQITKKSVTIGIIFLVLSMAFTSMSTAECNTDTTPIKPFITKTGDNPQQYEPHIFAIWRIHGAIRDLRVWENSIHFNTTWVVDSALGILFLLPFLPIPIVKRMISVNEEWWVIWDGPFLFHHEKITENYVDLFAVMWGEWYSPGFTMEIQKK